MPEISLFYGIRVTMYYEDHNPPHFHAEYNGNKAIVDIIEARVFKKEEGISITDYVIRMRIKKASELLQYSEISINEIAMKVGYDNFSYFSRLCKKMLGCSPKDYRKKAKEKLNE